MTTTIPKRKKRKLLRHNEYYDTQKLFDKLYQDSLLRKEFKHLYDYVISDDIIKLAYRNIKRNRGAKTAGVDNKTILDIEKEDVNQIIREIRGRLEGNYQPNPVRRVEIPKPNGKTRPLGIPTFHDKLIDECIKLVLEPICEARFYNHSYGFRPNRKAEHAIARMSALINISGLVWVVDIDIKGFFDNVNHGKLLKQLWALGVKDKTLLSIISKRLRVVVEYPDNHVELATKGTPQGGILSPLFSNVVLNELDWWIDSQWESMKTNFQYKPDSSGGNSRKTAALKNTNLKEIRIIRYADDFKIMCRDEETANKIFIATKMWLKERLDLDISEEKSKITDLRTNSSEFLGFRIKAKFKPDKKKYIAITHMSNNNIKRVKTNLKDQIKEIQKSPTHKNVCLYNSMILGIHNYYGIATRINKDLSRIHYVLGIVIYNRLKNRYKTSGNVNTFYKKRFPNNYKKIFIDGMVLYPIGDVKYKTPLGFTQKICNYTDEGRNLIHDKLVGCDNKILYHILKNPIPNRSIEYNDNKLSLYSAQQGLCAITGIRLEKDNMECHHKVRICDGGTDRYDNLILLDSNTHKLIHAVNEEIIVKYMEIIKPTKIILDKINALRNKVGNPNIEMN